jgi:REP-associated tyrosine transposase
MIRMLTGTPDRLQAFDYLGLHRYFLTFCTFERQPLFTTREAVDEILMQIQRGAREERFALIAYCFMPDHVHLLIEARADDSDARRFIKAAKQYSGFYFKKRFGRQLWQRYGFERTLRNDEATLSVVRYIIENPVRAKLVQNAEDYPFAGSSVYGLAEILEVVAFEPNRGSR